MVLGLVSGEMIARPKADASLKAPDLITKFSSVQVNPDKNQTTYKVNHNDKREYTGTFSFSAFGGR